MEEIKSVFMDLETFSDVDLSKCGVYKYSESPNFEVLLFGYSVNGGEVKVVDLACGETIPQRIVDALFDENVTKWSYNNNFERVCLSRHFGTWFEPENWRCTMVWASYLGLPRSLEDAGAVLGLEKQKLTEGKDLIRYFCVPCRPTKTNGGRTRNLPEHDMEKWERFKAYNLRDVEAEMQIQRRLSGYPVPDEVWEQYRQDQEINDRGIGVDMELVAQAIRMDALSHERLSDAMKELTELDNPNSVQQMKQWLAENGMETESLDKKAVSALLKTAPEPLAEVLELRQQLAKSSVKKYTAMRNAVCADSRARGMFQFYGANRTGRFSGRLVQLQNLPQNHMPDLAQARELVRCGDFDALAIIETEQKLKDLEKQANESSVALQKIAATGEKLKGVGDRISSAGEKLLPVTAGVAALGTAAVTTAANFESSMSQVQATMGITADSVSTVNGESVNTMDTLSALAKKMGSETAFSASECAEALNYLALAGYDTQQMCVTLPTVLNLAAAGGIDLASASDMVTDAMSALGMGVDEAETMVDQMAKTASSTNTSVAQLGEGILTIGATAKSIKGGTAELNTALGILANNGIKGAEGGTHLRNVILSLQNPTDKAADCLDSLGVSVYDSEGNMRSLNDILGDLNTSMDGMTAEEKANIISRIFNKTDLSSVNLRLILSQNHTSVTASRGQSA